jgi:hypothetical protein
LLRLHFQTYLRYFYLNLPIWHSKGGGKAKMASIIRRVNGFITLPTPTKTECKDPILDLNTSLRTPLDWASFRGGSCRRQCKMHILVMEKRFQEKERNISWDVVFDLKTNLQTQITFINVVEKSLIYNESLVIGLRTLRLSKYLLGAIYHIPLDVLI